MRYFGRVVRHGMFQAKGYISGAFVPHSFAGYFRRDANGRFDLTFHVLDVSNEMAPTPAIAEACQGAGLNSSTPAPPEVKSEEIDLPALPY